MSEYEETVQDTEYTVILVFPGFGEERENAEQIIEEAIEFLNIPNYEPGMRFAPNVRAHLETVIDVEQAQSRLESDDDLAMMFMHDLDDDEKRALTEECADRGVLVCHTVDTSDRPRRKRPRGKKREWTLVFKKREGDAPRAHQIAASTLTAPPDGDEEELSDRIGQVIMVLALGVMEHHWTRNPPKYRLLPEPESE